MSRIHLENDNYTILIDKTTGYQKTKELLAAKGGYLLQYHGELTKKKGTIAYKDIDDIFDCLDTFLSFVNGRRTSALFITGIAESEVKWSDYTARFVDPAKYVMSWADLPFIHLNDIWKRFCELWKDKNDRDFLVFAVHWYVESNGNAVFAEGSTIMAQTALELLYNWLIIENRKVLMGRDAESISAANKIRLLLSQMNVGYSVPEAFEALQEFVSKNPEVEDGPDAVVQIRNVIVHSQQEKRKKLNAISNEAKFEALQLCISYIELSLLYILGFKEHYFDRCGKGSFPLDRDTQVPWK